MSKENDAQFMRSTNHIYKSQQHNMPPRYTRPDPVKLNDYKNFVDKVTSAESSNPKSCCCCPGPMAKALEVVATDFARWHA